MSDIQDSRPEVVLTAEFYGAMFRQDRGGLWTTLNQPLDSVLGLAVFRSETDAAAAYCIAHGFPQSRNERLPPRFNEPARHGYKHPDWAEAVWWTKTAPGIHQATEQGHDLEIVYDGRHTMPWTGTVDGQEVCRGEARMNCEAILIEHVRGTFERIAALTTKDIPGLRSVYSAEPALDMGAVRL